MRLVIIPDKKNLIVRIAGELDHHNSFKVKDELDAHLSKDIAKNIVLNLRELNFMDSSGLGVILGRYKKVREKGGKIIACEVNPQLLKILELSGLKKIIPIVDSEKTAINCL